MSNKLGDVFGTDASEIENGTWVDLRPATGKDKAIRVKLRSIHSRVVRREEQRLDKKYRVQYIANNGFLDPESQDEKDVLLLSRAVLVDWDGMVGDSGDLLPFTPTVVQDTLRQFPQMRRELFIHARTDENFRTKAQAAAEREGMAGNS